MNILCAALGIWCVTAPINYPIEVAPALTWQGLRPYKPGDGRTIAIAIRPDGARMNLVVRGRGANYDEVTSFCGGSLWDNPRPCNVILCNQAAEEGDGCK
jgi:hypothetical protein